MSNFRKAVLAMTTVAILGGTLHSAHARTQVTLEQYVKILTCMKLGNSNATCVARVLGPGAK